MGALAAAEEVSYEEGRAAVGWTAEGEQGADGYACEAGSWWDVGVVLAVLHATHCMLHAARWLGVSFAHTRV